MNSAVQGYVEILDAHTKLKQMRYDHWVQYELFTFQWWTVLILAIITWIVWWKTVDRKHIDAIVIYGLFVTANATGMDAFGISHHLWIYPIKLNTIIPHMTPINWALLPVIYMLVYQYAPEWKSFVIANTIMSALLAFVGEPFAEWFGIYYVLRWEHYWSFPIYLTIALAGKWITEKLLSLKHKVRKEYDSINDWTVEDD